MTRKEAIQVLNRTVAYESDFAEAKRMAIEALSAEAPKPTGELIARADAIEAVQDHFNADGFKGYDDGQKMMDRLKALPSAEAVGVCKAHEEEHLNIVNRIKELQYAIAKTQTVVGKMAESAEAVQGEWKPFDLTWGRNVYFCTACKESTEVPTVNGQPSYNFCPNCGARMNREDGEA